MLERGVTLARSLECAANIFLPRHNVPFKVAFGGSHRHSLARHHICRIWEKICLTDPGV